MLGYKIEHKEDVWRVPADAQVLYVSCGLSKHNADRIIQHCRSLEKIVFTGDAYALTHQDVKAYLKQHIFVEVAGTVEHHNLNPRVVKDIKEKFNYEDWHIDKLAKHYKLPQEMIWHVVHDKHPIYIKKTKKKRTWNG